MFGLIGGPGCPAWAYSTVVPARTLHHLATCSPRPPRVISLRSSLPMSRLMGADEERTHERLKVHRRQLIDPKIKEHHGRIVKTTGDGMLVEFSSVVDAVRCAVEMQRGMLDRTSNRSPAVAQIPPLA
jgi:hypothetical protein